MGDSPPIPVDPVQSVPEAVLHQTPRYQQPGQPPGLNEVQGDLGQAPSGYPSQPQPQQPQRQQSSSPGNRYPTPPQPPQMGRSGQSYPDGQLQQPIQNGTPGRFPQGQGMAQPNNHSVQPHFPQQSMTGNQQQQPQQQFMAGTHQTHQTPRTHNPSAMPGPRDHHNGNMSDNHQPDLHHSKSQAAPSRNYSSGRQDAHRRAASLTVPTRADTTDSYLDRVENDPKLRSMLSGAPTRTIHTGVPLTGSSVMSATDKPLPNLKSKSKRSASHRQSLMDGLHGQHATPHINTGDRYPNFPKNGNGNGHSRQPSFDSGEPTRRTHES